MPKGQSDPNGESNRVLRSLPSAVYRRLSRQFDLVPLASKQVVYRRDRPVDYVYFPQDGVLSLLIGMRDGSMVEAATVGNEGIVGMGVIFETLHVHLSVLCQVPGSAVRVRASTFKKELDRTPALRQVVHHYAQALMVQFTQGVACNRLHTVEERCARWLLMTHDRVAMDTFSLTQEFLGQMLGVRRASVTVVAGILQKRGLIHYSRGVIRIVDRKGLEKQSCECYEVIRKEVDRLTRGLAER